MKTICELHEILKKHNFCNVDAHIHTYLCDGGSDMNVKNIAEQALKKGLTCIILTPHFHKNVSDETTNLYTDTNEDILLQLRREVDKFKSESKKDLTVLLSTEADILNINGTTSLKLSKKAEDALDLVTPTVNYHPLLPLRAVEVTYSKRITEIHSSGTYDAFAQKIGGVEKVLETLYETEVNAIINSPYPSILGHFFAAHSYVTEKYNWFGALPKHLDIMEEGADKIIDACVKTGAMIDLTGIHCKTNRYDKKQNDDGFFYDFQKRFIQKCKKNNILIFPGSDAHATIGVGNIEYYRQKLYWEV